MAADASLHSRRVLALAALGWAGASALELLAMLLVPQSALRRASLPVVDRLSLAAFDLLALALVLTPFLVLLGLARWRLARGKTLATTLLAVPLYAGVTLALTSWVGLKLESMFVDLEGLAAWLPHPEQVFKWVNPAVVLASPLCAVPVTLALVVWLPRALEKGSPVRLLSLSLGCLVALSGLQVTFLAFRRTTDDPEELVVDEAEGAARYSRDARYVEAQRTAAGAFAHALLDVGALLFPGKDEPRLEAGLAVERPPLLSLDDYLRAVPAGAARLNVVVLEVESLRADRLQAFGAEREVMPAVDAFARGAVRFSRAWTVAPQTNYAAPSPLSSQYPLRSSRLYVYPAALPFPRVMLFDVLKARGYRVGVFSSQDERWGNMKSYLVTPSVDAFFEAGEYLESAEGKGEQERFSRAKTRALEGGCLDDAITVDHALTWLAESDGPFFLSLNLQVSHFPYTLPPGGVRRFGPEAVDFSMDYAAWPKAKASEVKGLFDDALGYVDGQVRRVLDALEAKGLSEQTIVVLTSDHGEAFQEHGESCHANTLFEEAVRVPLLVRAPGLAPRTLDVPAQLIDVAPTVAGLLSLPPHPAWQGVDLLGPVPVDRDVFLVVHTPIGHQYGVVQGTEKLVLDRDSGQTRLHDLATDPGETVDLASKRPERVKALRARLDSWRAAQLGYYKDPVQQSVSYAPRLSLPAARDGGR